MNKQVIYLGVIVLLGVLAEGNADANNEERSNSNSAVKKATNNNSKRSVEGPGGNSDNGLSVDGPPGINRFEQKRSADGYSAEHEEQEDHLEDATHDRDDSGSTLDRNANDQNNLDQSSNTNNNGRNGGPGGRNNNEDNTDRNDAQNGRK